MFLLFTIYLIVYCKKGVCHKRHNLFKNTLFIKSDFIIELRYLQVPTIYLGKVLDQSFCSTPKPAFISALGMGNTKLEIL